MNNVVGVRFKENGKIYYFDPAGIAVKPGKKVIVETARGIEIGVAVTGIKSVEDSELVMPLRSVVRIANPRDFKTVEYNKIREKEAYKIATDRIAELELEMVLSHVEIAFDGSKIVFYFTAEGRVDFRELVKELAGEFKTRIELRQIGVRDESRILGGLGICGRPFCCSTFLNDFHAVSIRMAKEQGMSLSPGKISGTCGRLMCCLKYEQSSYDYLYKITPKKGTVVDCELGRGTVVDVSLLSGKLKVSLDASPDGAPVTVDREDVIPVSKSRAKE